MRCALFGGTFDPVHNGHLLLAESARVAFKLHAVIFIPTGIPPHKLAATASAADRLRMLRAATRSNAAFQVSDWEIRQKRVVYSFETIAHFRAAMPRAKLYFIVGSDMLKTIDLWKHGRALLDQCVFLAAERPEIPWSSLPHGVRSKAKRIPGPAVPFSSHEIRRRVKRRESIRYQVPESVERYILKKRLYR